MKTTFLLCTLGAVIALTGCASNLRVVSRGRTKTVGKADGDLFLRGPAASAALTSQPLPATQCGQEFHVSWAATVDTVRFEYRQASAPNRVQEQVIQPRNRHDHLFFIHHDTGPDVTAWRVTLLRGGAVVAQRQSALW